MKLTPLALAVIGAMTAYPTLADDLQGTRSTAKNESPEVIVISGSRTEKQLKDVAGSISVMTAQDIEKQQPVDMSELFKYEPGVFVTGSAGNAQNIRVRGIGGDRVLMIKDGMRMNEGYGANGRNDIVGRGFIDLELVKQVEVAKGAASSLYGSDALAGIVVFNTKDASDFLAQGETFGGSAKAGYTGINNSRHASTNVALKTGDIEHLFHAGKRKGDEQQNFDESKQPFQIDSTSLLYKGKWALSPQQSLTFMVDHWQQEKQGDSANGLLGYFRSLASFGYKIVDESFEGKQTATSYQLRYQSKAPTPLYDQLNLSLYRNKTEQSDVEYGKLDINAPRFGVKELRNMWETSVFTQDTKGLLSNAVKQLSNTHTLGFGIDLEYSDSERTEYEFRTAKPEGEDKFKTIKDELSNKFPKNRVKRAGAFINDEISLANDTLVITPGARFDWFEMDPNGALKEDGKAFNKVKDENISLNLGALYKFTPNLSAFAQYGQGFKVPSYDLAYIEHDNSQYGYKIVPSDDLVPEESDTYELGIRGNSGSLSFEATLFKSDYSNFLETSLLEIQTTTVHGHGGPVQKDIKIYQYQNIDSAKIKGIELGATYLIGDHWSVYANASYQHGKGYSVDDAGQRVSEYLDSISPLSGTLGLEYGSETLSSNLILRWADKMDDVDDGEASTGGYGVVDWLASYQLTDQLSFNLATKNLLDKKYMRYESIGGASHSEDISRQTEPGRTFSASVKYSF